MSMTPSQINEIKNKVKKEMQRRGGSTAYNSLASFAGAAYDFTVAPASGGAVLVEHGNKIIEPLIQIKDIPGVKPAVKGEKISSGFTYTNLNQAVTNLAKETVVPAAEGPVHPGAAAAAEDVLLPAEAAKAAGNLAGVIAANIVWEAVVFLVEVPVLIARAGANPAGHALDLVPERVRDVQAAAAAVEMVVPAVGATVPVAVEAVVPAVMAVPADAAPAAVEIAEAAVPAAGVIVVRAVALAVAMAVGVPAATSAARAVPARVKRNVPRPATPLAKANVSAAPAA